MKKIVAGLCILTALAASSSIASAGQDSTQVRVTATLGAACSFGGQGTMNLYFPIPAGSTGTMSQMGPGALNNILCTSAMPWTLTDEGNPAVEDGSYTGTATDGTNNLTYHLSYSPTSGSSNAVVTVTGFINETETLPAKGYAGLPAGTYSGQVNLLLNF